MITLVTAWYNFKNKFDLDTYDKWMSNIINNCNKFNLVIYTDRFSYPIFSQYRQVIENNDKIKIVIKETDEFYTKQYNWKENQNHSRNPLKDVISYKLNMLWNEKINLVYDAYRHNYFNTNIWGWCDIGYFRCRNGLDISSEELKQWPSHHKLSSFNNNNIYYTAVNPLCNCDKRQTLPCCNNGYMNKLASHIKYKNAVDLPLTPIPENQVSIAGGFFLTHGQNIKWWHETFYNRLDLYFKHNYLVKDDQIIIIDCIVNNYNKFILIEQPKFGYDRWFAFANYFL
jgi:hypothetical protein